MTREQQSEITRWLAFVDGTLIGLKIFYGEQQPAIAEAHKRLDEAMALVRELPTPAEIDNAAADDGVG